MYIFGIKTEAKQPAKANLKTSRFPFFSQNSLKNLKNIRKTLKKYNIFWKFAFSKGYFEWLMMRLCSNFFRRPTTKQRTGETKLIIKFLLKFLFVCLVKFYRSFFFKFNEKFQFCNLIFWYDRVSFMIKCQKHFADTLFLSLLIYNFFYFFFVSEFKETKEI